jgi:transposase
VSFYDAARSPGKIWPGATGFPWGWWPGCCTSGATTGDLRPRHRFSGRKPKLLGTHRRQLRELLRQKPNLTLQELQGALEVDCTLQAIHYVLADMGLSYKK